MLLRLQGQIIDGQIIEVKCKKITINRPFNFYPPIIELVRELVISNMHNKFGKDKKLFKLLRPQGQIFDVKCNKLQ